MLHQIRVILTKTTIQNSNPYEFYTIKLFFDDYYVLSVPITARHIARVLKFSGPFLLSKAPGLIN